MSTAVSVRVGNELGAGNPKGAKRAAFVSCGVSCKQLIYMITVLINFYCSDLYNSGCNNTRVLS